MAVSVTVTATKIDVTSTAGVQETLSAVVTAVGDTSVMEEVGSVITIKRAVGQVYRELEISNNCKIKFEEDHTTNFEGVSNTGTYYLLDFADGSEIEVEPGHTFDFNSDGQTYARAYIICYGQLIMGGTQAKPIVVQNYRSWYDYSRADQTWTYVELKEPTYAGGYLYYSENYTKTKGAGLARSYTNVTVSQSTGNAGYCYFSYTGNPWDGVTYSDWTFTNLDRVYFYISTMKVTRFSFSNFKNPLFCYGAGNAVGSSAYDTATDNDTFSKKRFQPSLTFDECSFDSFTTSYFVYAFYGATTYFRSCDFDTESYGIYGQHGARTLEYGDSNTFTSVTVPRRWGAASTFLRCREIDLTVQDQAGTPIEDATVTLTQESSKRERWTAMTDSDGTILNVHGDLPRLVEREETSPGLFSYWSNDLSGGTAFHRIRVDKPGYLPVTHDLEMTTDQTVTITLIPENHPLMDVDTQTLYLPAEGRLIKKAG